MVNVIDQVVSYFIFCTLCFKNETRTCVTIDQEYYVTFIQDGNGDISFNEFVWLMTK